MPHIIHNPWTWQQGMGFEQGVEVPAGGRTVYCAGQTAVDANGEPQAAGDYTKQFLLALDNVERVLSMAGMTLADVVRMNLYTTDVQGHFGALGDLVDVTDSRGMKAAGTLLEVQSLAMPGLLVELEATAVAP